MWFIVYQPFALLLFLVAGLAEINRTPFDMPEAESELACGFNIEYSQHEIRDVLHGRVRAHDRRWPASSRPCFWAGGSDRGRRPWASLVLHQGMSRCYSSLSGSGGLSRGCRYDQIMQFGWKVLFPLALANVVVTAFVVAVVR